MKYRNYEKISFFIIARNAERYLPGILKDILNQDYPSEQTEFILVDGSSEDKTLDIFNDFKNAHNNIKIKILNNHKRILASGWNLALSNAIGDIIFRVDAHSKLPSDFIRKNVELIVKGENIVGGQRITVIPDKPYQQLISLAEMSKFGAGSAAYRNYKNAGYVDTLAHAAYSRHVFETVGGYDERLVRTEDNEMHYRLKKSGFKFYYNPEIRSFHISRGDLRALLKQKYSNGLWIGLTMGIQPRCFSLRHFIPLFFVLSLLVSISVAKTYAGWCSFIVLISTYLLISLIFAFKAMAEAEKKVKIICPVLPIIFLLMHLSYGLGTMFGLIRMPYFVWKNRKYSIPFPMKAQEQED